MAEVAPPAQRAAFLAALPRWSGIVVGHTAAGHAIALEERHDAATPRVVHGSTGARLFEHVRARVAIELLAESIISSAVATDLRSRFQRGLAMTRPMRGVSAWHRRAFDCARQLAQPDGVRALQARIEAALASGLAQLIDWRFLPAADVSILWTALQGPLAGQRIETRASADTLAVRAAGICVSGADAAFDVASLASAVARRPRELWEKRNGFGRFAQA